MFYPCNLFTLLVNIVHLSQRRSFRVSYAVWRKTRMRSPAFPVLKAFPLWAASTRVSGGGSGGGALEHWTARRKRQRAEDVPVRCYGLSCDEHQLSAVHLPLSSKQCISMLAPAVKIITLTGNILLTVSCKPLRCIWPSRYLKLSLSISAIYQLTVILVLKYYCFF